MHQIKKSLLLLSVFGIMSQVPVAFAGCSGSVTDTSCPRYSLSEQENEKKGD